MHPWTEVSDVTQNIIDLKQLKSKRALGYEEIMRGLSDIDMKGERCDPGTHQEEYFQTRE